MTGQHAERAGDTALAIECFEQAGREAEKRFANTAAVAWLRRALALMGEAEPMRRFDVLNLLGRWPMSWVTDRRRPRCTWKPRRCSSATPTTPADRDCGSPRHCWPTATATPQSPIGWLGRRSSWLSAAALRNGPRWRKANWRGSTSHGKTMRARDTSRHRHPVGRQGGAGAHPGRNGGTVAHLVGHGVDPASRIDEARTFTVGAAARRGAGQAATATGRPVKPGAGRLFPGPMARGDDWAERMCSGPRHRFAVRTWPGVRGTWSTPPRRWEMRRRHCGWHEKNLDINRPPATGAWRRSRCVCWPACIANKVMSTPRCNAVPSR